MDVKWIEQLYEYNGWANARIVEAASRLTAGEFTKDLRSSYRSVRDTLVHVMSAEWIWLMRWKGISPQAMLAASDFETISPLKARWAEIRQEQAEFVSAATEESLRSAVSYINTRGEPFTYALWQMMQHVVNHSTYHRGQVTTMLRQLEAEPIATDFLVFYDMRAA